MIDKEMKSKSPKKNSCNGMPTVHVMLTYDCLYDDYDSVNVHTLLKGIPTICVLNFIVKKFGEVIYSLANNNKQRTFIREMCNHIKGEPRRRIWKFLNGQKHVYLIDSYGTILLEALALQNYTETEEDDDCLELCDDEYESVYKALLYCNQRVTELQQRNMTGRDLTELSLLVDVPYVEFKLYKDFETQMFKAIKFFEFCEGNEHYSQGLMVFEREHGVNDWKEYLTRLFAIVNSALKSRYIKVDESHYGDVAFFDQFVINLAECSNLWENQNALTYFRNHFLLKLPKGLYLLLNANFLVDKMYQGMRFDFFQTLKKNSICDSNGHVIKSYPDFISDIGDKFSEHVLLYNFMKDVFGQRCDAIFIGEELKTMGIEAEPDLYMRIGKTLFLFENKDVTLSETVKYSADVKSIKKEIFKKICKYEERSKKGAGQLHATMEGIFKIGTFDEVDPGIKDVVEVFPIILTTDRVFSAMGVNRLVIEEYSRIIEQHKIDVPVFISVPVIMDFDTIIKCGYRLKIGQFKLPEMLRKYILYNEGNLGPFNTFIIDEYINKLPYEPKSTEFLFGDFVESINN